MSVADDQRHPDAAPSQSPMMDAAAAEADDQQPGDERAQRRAASIVSPKTMTRTGRRQAGVHSTGVAPPPAPIASGATMTAVP